MPRIVLLCPDLLFGSKVEGGLAAGGHEVTRCDDDASARAQAREGDLLIVDLTAEAYDGAAVVRAMGEAGELDALRTLGFYSHVDQETRRRAEEAGFDLVVPRSRMARDQLALVAGLIAE